MWKIVEAKVEKTSIAEIKEKTKNKKKSEKRKNRKRKKKPKKKRIMKVQTIVEK